MSINGTADTVSTGAPFQASTFQGGGGTLLYESSYRSARARATLVVVHGIGEHARRYGSVADACMERNIDLRAFDLRGHGNSGGIRGHVDHWHEYRDDLGLFIDHVRATSDRNPLFIMGHSLGSLIAIDFVIERQPDLRGLIVSGVPLRPAGIAKPHLVLAARLLAGVLPKVRLSLGIDPGDLTRIPDEADAYRSDPLVFRKVTVRWGVESMDAVRRLRRRMNEVRTPLLIVHGASDAVNLAEGARELAAGVSSTDRTLLLHPDGRHEPHNDTNGASVAAYVCDWIAERL